MITPIHIGDLPQIYAICDRANEHMNWNEMGYPYSHEAMKENWLKVLDDSHHVKFCVRNGEEIEGIFLARLQAESYFTRGHLVAVEVALHADPMLSKTLQAKLTVKIIRAAEKILSDLGVKTFLMNTHPQRYDMSLNLVKHGYKPFSYTMAKEL
jgi:hypothetical protein